MTAYTAKEINEGRSLTRRMQAISDDMYNSIGHTHRRLTVTRLKGISEELSRLAESIECQTVQEQAEWKESNDVADATLR